DLTEIVAELRRLVITWFNGAAPNEPAIRRFIGRETPFPESVTAEVSRYLILKKQEAALANEYARHNKGEPPHTTNDTIPRREVGLDKVLGILNKDQFNQDLSWIVTATVAKSQPVSLAMIDIDEFKKFNEEFGHDVGDRILRQLAETLKTVGEAHGP